MLSSPCRWRLNQKGGYPNTSIEPLLNFLPLPRRVKGSEGSGILLGWPAEKPGFLEKPGFCGPRRSPASWRSRASVARGEARLLGEAGLLWAAEKPGFLEKPGFCGPRRSPASWRSRASVARGEARLLGEAGLLWPAEKPGFLEKPGFCGPRRSPASWRSRASVARGEAGLLWPAEKPGFSKKPGFFVARYHRVTTARSARRPYPPNVQPHCPARTICSTIC